MSITGIKPGDVKGLLQKVKDRQAGSLQKVADLAVKSETVAQTMDAMTSTADKELDTRLSELGQFSNLGPELNDTPVPPVGPYPSYPTYPTKPEGES